MVPEEPSTEVVTPHKVALLALISVYADITDGRHKFHRIIWLEDELMNKRRLNRVLLTWIQQPHGTLKNILHVVGACSRNLHSALCTLLPTFCDCDGPQILEDFFQQISLLIQEPPEGNLLQRGGILGLFCRRMVLYYDKLTFSQLLPLHDELARYCAILLSCKPARVKEPHSPENDRPMNVGGENRSDSFDEMELESQSELDSKSSDESGVGAELKPSDLKTTGKSDDLETTEMYTSRQADFFFAQQAALITDKESMAMSPAKLQKKISHILRSNPKLTEAHYLSYLNCLRVREFCGAADCLLQYFNRQTRIAGVGPQTNATASNGASQICRYAALNLSLLHFRFGHRKAALAAAREAVELSQLAADTQCLQHAMSLMNQLDPSSVHLSLLEHQVKPAKQMNLIQLAANSIQRDVNKQALLGKRPSQVFKQLTASEAFARTRTVEGITATGYVHKGALWRMYGKRHMSALYCQLALTYQGSNRSGPNLFPWQPNTPEIALSLCHLVELLHQAGEIPEAQEVLRHLKQRFPKHTEHCKLWQITELRLAHKMALRSCKFSEAIATEQMMTSLDKKEAEFRKAERLYTTGDKVQAHAVLQRLLEDFDSEEDVASLCGNEQCTTEMQCKINLLLSCVLFEESCDCSASLSYALHALSIAEKGFLSGLVVEAKLLIAQLQLYSKLPTSAHRTLGSCVHECLTNGLVMEKCRLQTIQAKCLLVREDLTIKDLDRCILLLLSAQHGFEILLDLHRQKDAAYLLARLFNEKLRLVKQDPSLSDESPSEIAASRNKCSSTFVNLDALTFSSVALLLV